MVRIFPHSCPRLGKHRGGAVPGRFGEGFETVERQPLPAGRDLPAPCMLCLFGTPACDLVSAVADRAGFWTGALSTVTPSYRTADACWDLCEKTDSVWGDGDHFKGATQRRDAVRESA